MKNKIKFHEVKLFCMISLDQHYIHLTTEESFTLHSQLNPTFISFNKILVHHIKLIYEQLAFDNKTTQEIRAVPWEFS